MTLRIFQGLLNTEQVHVFQTISLIQLKNLAQKTLATKYFTTPKPLNSSLVFQWEQYILADTVVRLVSTVK